MMDIALAALGYALWFVLLWVVTLWIMAYDNYPLEVIRLKQKLIPHYRRKNCWFTFYHDTFMKACRLDDQGQITEQVD